MGSKWRAAKRVLYSGASSLAFVVMPSSSTCPDLPETRTITRATDTFGVNAIVQRLQGSSTMTSFFPTFPAPFPQHPLFVPSLLVPVSFRRATQPPRHNGASWYICPDVSVAILRVIYYNCIQCCGLDHVSSPHVSLPLHSPYRDHCRVIQASSRPFPLYFPCAMDP